MGGTILSDIFTRKKVLALAKLTGKAELKARLNQVIWINTNWRLLEAEVVSVSAKEVVVSPFSGSAPRLANTVCWCAKDVASIDLQGGELVELTHGTLFKSATYLRQGSW